MADTPETTEPREIMETVDLASVDPPVVTIGTAALGTKGEELMASEINPNVPVDGLPVEKFELRANLLAAKQEIEALQTRSEAIILALSDEATELTTGASKLKFRMPYAFTLTSVRASVGTAPTGSSVIVDINETGSGTILSTKLSIDAGQKTSQGAATPAVISDASLGDNSEIAIDIDQVGSTFAGNGLKVYLIGTRP